MRGIVYTDTVIHSAPEGYSGEVPYQIVVVVGETGERVTGRVLGERVRIGDAVELAETREQVPFFRKQS